MTKTRTNIFENKDINNDLDEYILDTVISYSIKDVDNYQVPIIDIGEYDNIVQNESDIISLNEEHSKEDIFNIKNNISEIKNDSSRFSSVNNFVYNINLREEAALGLNKNMQDGIKTLEITNNENNAIEEIINDEATEVVELSGLDIDCIVTRHQYADPKNDEWTFKKQIHENDEVVQFGQEFKKSEPASNNQNTNDDLNKEWQYQNKNVDNQEVQFGQEFKKSEPASNNQNTNDDLNKEWQYQNKNVDNQEVQFGQEFKKNEPSSNNETINDDLNKEWKYQNKNVDNQEVKFEQEFKKNELSSNNQNTNDDLDSSNEIKDIHELLNNDLAELSVNDDALDQIENNIENADISAHHLNEIDTNNFLGDDEDITIDEDILKQIESGSTDENDELLEEIIDSPETTSNSFLGDNDDIAIDNDILSSIENTLKKQNEINIEYISDEEVNQEEVDSTDDKDEFPIDEIYEKNTVEIVDDINADSFNGEFSQDNLDNAIKRYEDGVDSSTHLAKEIDVMVSSYEVNRLSSMLSFIDDIIKSLPEDKQLEFAKSEHYDAYMYFVKKINNL